MFFVYNLLLVLAAAILTPYHVLRGRRRGKYHGSVGQRFGNPELSVRQTAGRSIWLHAVSVGEVLSCQELVRQLRERFPRTLILVSTSTATGQKVAREKLAGQADGFFFAPVDLPFAVRRTLRRVKPFLVVVAETEIWPNLFREAKRCGASLLMVNARISDRSAPRYRRFRFFFRRVLALPDRILAQSALDRDRLIAAGAPPDRVETGGNLKFDWPVLERAAPPEIAGFLTQLSPAPVILAGSTREGEEAMVLAAFDRLVRGRGRLLLLLAPRHAERFDEVAALLGRQGRSFVRRSSLRPGQRLELPGVLLLDTLGELASLYTLADAVFVGGSLVPWGGHNVLEPALAGRPVVVGPHMQNFRAIAGTLLAAGGLVQVNSPGELAPALERLLNDRAEAARVGDAARRAAETHQGATRRAADRAEELYHRAVPCTTATSLERLFLWPFARLWEAGVRLRGRACGAASFAPKRLRAYTISVGNLTAGGTGKTPTVLWLLEQLTARGVRCAVLSRGYRRARGEKITVVEPGDPAPPELTGDEVQMVVRRFRAPTGIAADRYEAGCLIEERFQPEVIVLDDGFQHRSLARDLDVVLIDVTEPFGRREFLPLGRLREPLEALARANFILLTRGLPGERWEGLREELRRYNRDAPILTAQTKPRHLVDAVSGQAQPFTVLQDRRVLAFCGVGNPGAFTETLANTGAWVAEEVRFPDHHRYSEAEVQRLIARADRAGAEILVTTEKDLINLRGRSFSPFPLYWLHIALVIERGEKLLEKIPSLSQVAR
jgi:3-deoxy-D-manno-octulosonic-acid transferase